MRKIIEMIRKIMRNYEYIEMIKQYIVMKICNRFLIIIRGEK